MNLMQASLGERYEFYKDADLKLAVRDRGLGTIVATIIGINTANNIIVMGWKNSGEKPLGVVDNTTVKQHYPLKLITNIDEYLYAYALYAGAEVLRKIEVQEDRGTGYFCRSCNLPNPWAISNQADGSYLCFECRR